MEQKLNGKKVAILVADGFEQVEMTKPRAALDEAAAGGNPRQVIVRSFAEELKMFGDAVSYKRKGDTWFVVSGVNKAGLEFYSKAYANSSAVTLLRITYPHSQNSTYDPWVTLIEKNFKSARKVPSSRR